LKPFIKYASSIALTALFLYFAFRGTDFATLWGVLAGANYWWALALVVPLMLSNLFRAWRWEYLLRPVKQDLRFRNLFSAMMVGYMLNDVLPKAGEIARPYAIGKLERISKSAAFGTVLVERIFDLLSFLAVAALIPVVYSGPLLQVFPWLEQAGIWVTVITFVALGIFVVLVLRRDLVVRLLGVATRRLSQKHAAFVEKAAHSFLDGFLFLKEPKYYFPIFVLTVLVWFFYIVMMYIPFLAFHMESRYGLNLGAALVVQAISSIGFILPTPGATGTYHYFVIQTLTKLYNVDQPLAQSYATVTHAIGYLATMIVGIYFFFRDKLHLSDVRGKAALAVQPGEEEITGVS
jgi:uncharacterized protein (TIRG00374 family)